ncbi:hypothetical protein N7326_04485 [Corynebacterium sp. ES2794-CONJ1]|uniref:divisome protein SepX/GlpR n=1 Tax=unclassified Corynebacterium TaxID=2624378 RepID=UPI0021688A5B|nr:MULTISPECIES: gephyrin-like molybdotransferase receptor GlpR [unclassified Corynebacterium]MCS4490007.1 hypothetical protein [Corynebacterium sp. ES2775-CONJ]MCS4491630.1 hypothetical protein [Corynebacterium sp. ES2715-CONJ3]MCS4531735.1 hypothetical protein [Corynebacterium sp. ES2730-CONJ]MCU9519131.1 hypothetical protein [Corynebacterium sp. ES2794-CONJ1]
MTGLIGLLIIVVLWIFVLAPWFLRAQKPIRKAGEAFNETRVILEGGSKKLSPQRSLKKLPLEDSAVPTPSDSQLESDVEASGEENEPVNGEDQDEDSILIDPPIREQTISDLSSQATYEIDSSYTDPEDLLFPAPDEDTGDEVEDSEETPDNDDFSPEFTEEELSYIQARRGRGGFDPEADREAAKSRYQRRKIVVATMSVLLLVAVISAIVFGGLAWIAPALMGVIFVAYLIVLRKLVKSEIELRNRRIRHLRRSRLGVRSVSDNDLGIPQRLRHPGAVVLEIDDESADFQELELIDSAHYKQPTHDAEASRRVS